MDNQNLNTLKAKQNSFSNYNEDNIDQEGQSPNQNEEIIPCIKCKQVSEEYISLNCGHSFCLSCLALSFIQLKNQQKEEIQKGEGFSPVKQSITEITCAVCNEGTELDQPSVEALEGMVAMVFNVLQEGPDNGIYLNSQQQQQQKLKQPIAKENQNIKAQEQQEPIYHQNQKYENKNQNQIQSSLQTGSSPPNQTQTQIFCHKHANQKINLFCSDCESECFCDKCAVNPLSQHYHHNIRSINEGKEINSLFSRVDEIRQAMQDKTSQIKEIQEALRVKLQETGFQNQQKTQQLQDEFQLIAEQLEQKKLAIIQEINERYMKQQDLLIEYMRQVEDQLVLQEETEQVLHKQYSVDNEQQNNVEQNNIEDTRAILNEDNIISFFNFYAQSKPVVMSMLDWGLTDSQQNLLENECSLGEGMFSIQEQLIQLLNGIAGLNLSSQGQDEKECSNKGSRQICGEYGEKIKIGDNMFRKARLQMSERKKGYKSQSNSFIASNQGTYVNNNNQTKQIGISQKLIQLEQMASKIGNNHNTIVIQDSASFYQSYSQSSQKNKIKDDLQCSFQGNDNFQQKLLSQKVYVKQNVLKLLNNNRAVAMPKQQFNYNNNANTAQGIMKNLKKQFQKFSHMKQMFNSKLK